MIKLMGGYYNVIILFLDVKILTLLKFIMSTCTLFLKVETFWHTFDRLAYWSRARIHLM